MEGVVRLNRCEFRRSLVQLRPFGAAPWLCFDRSSCCIPFHSIPFHCAIPFHRRLLSNSSSGERRVSLPPACVTSRVVVESRLQRRYASENRSVGRMPVPSVPCPGRIYVRSFIFLSISTFAHSRGRTSLRLPAPTAATSRPLLQSPGPAHFLRLAYLYYSGRFS